MVEGVTAIGLPVIAPGFQVYEVAPLAVKVELCPEQIVVLDAEAFTTGKALTVTETVFVLVQPAVVPVTVYTVNTVGLTATDAVEAPVLHE